VHCCCPRQAVFDARKKRELHSELGLSGLMVRNTVGMDFIRIFILSRYFLR